MKNCLCCAVGQNCEHRLENHPLHQHCDNFWAAAWNAGCRQCYTGWVLTTVNKEMLKDVQKCIPEESEIGFRSPPYEIVEVQPLYSSSDSGSSSCRSSLSVAGSDPAFEDIFHYNLDE